MVQLVLIFLLGLVAVQAITPIELTVDEWKTWKILHGKTYDNQLYGSGGNLLNQLAGANRLEEKMRMKIWMENRATIAKHNLKALHGEQSYHMAMNEWGDLLHHEFVAMLNGYSARASFNNTSQESLQAASFIPPAHMGSPPENVDWRDQGAVTPVKNQDQCGSCWSFSATGALEAMHYRATGQLTSLSEQNLMDCSGKFGNMGCNGGFTDAAFQYIKENGGIDTEESYPYEGKDDTCRYNPRSKGATNIGFVDIEAGNETSLKTAIATQGPCSVAIDASHQSFQFYSHGVYRDMECSGSPQNLDHAVLVIGYGVEDNGEAYWLIKNSWGTTWGQKGYVKIARNENNMCGVATQASFPLVSTILK